MISKYMMDNKNHLIIKLEIQPYETRHTASSLVICKSLEETLYTVVRKINKMFVNDPDNPKRFTREMLVNIPNLDITMIRAQFDHKVLLILSMPENGVLDFSLNQFENNL